MNVITAGFLTSEGEPLSLQSQIHLAYIAVDSESKRQEQAEELRNLMCVQVSSD